MQNVPSVGGTSKQLYRFLGDGQLEEGVIVLGVVGA